MIFLSQDEGLVSNLSLCTISLSVSHTNNTSPSCFIRYIIQSHIVAPATVPPVLCQVLGVGTANLVMMMNRKLLHSPIPESLAQAFGPCGKDVLLTTPSGALVLTSSPSSLLLSSSNNGSSASSSSSSSTPSLVLESLQRLNSITGDGVSTLAISLNAALDYLYSIKISGPEKAAASRWLTAQGMDLMSQTLHKLNTTSPSSRPTLNHPPDQNSSSRPSQQSALKVLLTASRGCLAPSIANAMAKALVGRFVRQETTWNSLETDARALVDSRAIVSLPCSPGAPPSIQASSSLLWTVKWASRPSMMIAAKLSQHSPSSSSSSSQNVAYMYIPAPAPLPTPPVIQSGSLVKGSWSSDLIDRLSIAPSSVMSGADLEAWHQWLTSFFTTLTVDHGIRILFLATPEPPTVFVHAAVSAGIAVAVAVDEIDAARLIGASSPNLAPYYPPLGPSSTPPSPIPSSHIGTATSFTSSPLPTPPGLTSPGWKTTMTLASPSSSHSTLVISFPSSAMAKTVALTAYRQVRLLSSWASCKGSVVPGGGVVEAALLRAFTCHPPTLASTLACIGIDAVLSALYNSLQRASSSSQITPGSSSHHKTTSPPISSHHSPWLASIKPAMLSDSGLGMILTSSNTVILPPNPDCSPLTHGIITPSSVPAHIWPIYLETLAQILRIERVVSVRSLPHSTTIDDLDHDDEIH